MHLVFHASLSVKNKQIFTWPRRAMSRGHSQEGSWLALGLAAKAMGATSGDSGSGA